MDSKLGTLADCATKFRQNRLRPLICSRTRSGFSGDLGMRQRGSLTLGLGITIGLLSIALTGVGWLYNGALKEKARVQGEYEAFKEGTRQLGEEAEARNRKTLTERERIANERIKSLGARAAASAARADGLCKSAGLSAGCRALPAVPDTTRPVDDSAHNQRLVELLRHAQTLTDQLIELQEWVRSNSDAR